MSLNMPSRADRPQWQFSSRSFDRRGLTRIGLWLGLMVTGSAGAGIYSWAFRGPQQAAKLEHVIVQPVTRDRFVHHIAQRGEIESASNIDVYCEVKSAGAGSTGVAILDVIVEGTQVQPGDILATLDSSALEKERTAQQILCNTSEALLIQSKNLHETAKISLREYLDGTFVQTEQTTLGEIFVAEENLRRAEGYLKYSEELAAKNFYTTLQLEADRFAVDKAKNDLATAKTKLMVLRDYTKLKTAKQLEADIKTTEAKMRTDESTHALDMQKLAEIDEQISKCVIRAPAAGQVVYNNDDDDWDDNPVVIKAGTLVRERQIIFRLPDPKQMQVQAKINEANVNRVKTGMPASIKVDAFPDRELYGLVTKVNDYPEQSGWRGSNAKEYAAFVRIEDPPPGLRPGMTSDVRIQVEERPDVLQVPVQAVVEESGRHYCLIRTAGRIEARQVLLGSTNDKFLIVEDGLSEGDDVLLNPRVFLQDVELPDKSLVQAPARSEPTAGDLSDRLAAKPAQLPVDSAEQQGMEASAPSSSLGSGGGGE